MILTNELKGIIAQNGLSQVKVAEMIGVVPKTFYEKMELGVFGSDEIQIMIDKMSIENPMEIFLAKQATFKVTDRRESIDSKCVCA